MLERVVADSDEKANFLIDLDTGELHTPPAHLDTPEDKMAWAKRAGVDVVAEAGRLVPPESARERHIR